MPFGEITIDETYALTELRNGTFTVTPEIDNMLLDLNKVSVVLEPFTDPNTNTTYNHMDNRTLQVGVEHIFSMGFVDIYGNNLSKLIDMHPPFVISFEDESGGANYQVTEHYLNEISKRNEFKLNISTTVYPKFYANNMGIDYNNTGTLSIRLFGEHIFNSPFTGWYVLPGYYNFTKSYIFENNLKSTYYTNPLYDAVKQKRCYVGETCTQQFDLVDNFCNYVDKIPGILTMEVFNLDILGPYVNYDGRRIEYQYVRNVSQFIPERYEQYFSNYMINMTGTFTLFFRIRTDTDTQKSYTDPVEVEMYSDRISALNSESK